MTHQNQGVLTPQDENWHRISLVLSLIIIFEISTSILHIFRTIRLLQAFYSKRFSLMIDTEKNGTCSSFKSAFSMSLKSDIMPNFRAISSWQRDRSAKNNLRQILIHISPRTHYLLIWSWNFWQWRKFHPRFEHVTLFSFVLSSLMVYLYLHSLFHECTPVYRTIRLYPAPIIREAKGFSHRPVRSLSDFVSIRRSF